MRRPGLVYFCAEDSPGIDVITDSITLNAPLWRTVMLTNVSRSDVNAIFLVIELPIITNVSTMESAAAV